MMAAILFSFAAAWRK